MTLQPNISLQYYFLYKQVDDVPSSNLIYNTEVGLDDTNLLGNLTISDFFNRCRCKVFQTISRSSDSFCSPMGHQWDFYGTIVGPPWD